MTLALTPAQRRFLRARAHALNPVVMIGQHGLTEEVLREIDQALAHHELIKIRVLDDDRAHRESILHSVCDRISAAPVQHIGKLLVIYRPAEEPRLRLP
jgi:RNA-binding protein